MPIRSRREQIRTIGGESAPAESRRNLARALFSAWATGRPRAVGQMAKPIIGIIGNNHVINDQYAVQAVGVSNIEAVADLTGAIPLLVPALPKVGAISDL